MLLPEIYPHKNLDTTYELYLNYEFFPVVSPYKNTLHIDIKDNKFFRPASKVSSILNDIPSNIIKCAAFQPHNDMPTAKDLFKNLSLDMPGTEKATTLPSTLNYSYIVKKIFIQYTPDSNMKVR